MHQGRFPDRLDSRPEPAIIDRAAEGSPIAVSRRGMLVLLLGSTAIGALGAIALWSGRYSGARDDDAAPGDGADAEFDHPPDRGTLQWALWIAERPDDELLPAGGDLERVSMRHRDEVRLVPGFVRVLEVAMRSREPEADEAGACAVRSLARLHRFDIVLDREARILARVDRPATRDAFLKAASRRRSPIRGHR